jgi:RNA polymerase sigma-54 factor
MLTVIHELEPSGVGARDLQECLLLQLKHKTPSESVELTDIIENQFDAFTKKHYEKLIQKYNVSNEQLKSNSRNRKAQSKTRWCFYGNNKITENVVPDFAIRIVDGELELTLNGRNAPSLHVSKDYQEMMQTYKESDKSGPQKTQFNLSNK